MYNYENSLLMKVVGGGRDSYLGRVVEEDWKKGERGCRPNLEEIREAVSQAGWGGGLKGRLGQG